MKIIDGKGRLFGKINIIDFVVILFLLSFIPMLYFGYKVLTARDIDKGRWVDIRVEFRDLMPELIRVMKEDDIELGISGEVKGKIKKILRIKSSEVLILADNKVLDMAGHPYKKDILADLTLLCDEKSNAFYYKDNPVKIGEPISFSTDFYIVKGAIVGMERKD